MEFNNHVISGVFSRISRAPRKVNRHGSNLSSNYIVPIYISLIIHNGVCVESLRSYVRSCRFAAPFTAVTWRDRRHSRGALERLLLTYFLDYSYNKYLSVAARTVRRSLKDDKRLAAERRGEMELRFSKWTVSDS